MCFAYRFYACEKIVIIVPIITCLIEIIVIMSEIIKNVSFLRMHIVSFFIRHIENVRRVHSVFKGEPADDFRSIDR